VSALTAPRTARGELSAELAASRIWDEPTTPGDCRACNGLGEVPTYQDSFGNFETGPCLRCHETGRAR
jgi:DnaJ-class molecular chaperone